MAQAGKRTKFTPYIDLALLQEVINHNPFIDAAKWVLVVDALQDTGDGAPATARSCKERVVLFMEYFKKDQLAKINKYVNFEDIFSFHKIVLFKFTAVNYKYE